MNTFIFLKMAVWLEDREKAGMGLQRFTEFYYREGEITWIEDMYSLEQIAGLGT